MENLLNFLQTSYTAFQTTENAKEILLKNGFQPLDEREEWNLKRGGKYFVTRNMSSLIAFTVGDGNPFKLVASHNDSCCLKLKDNPEVKGEFTRLNVEPYGGGLWYTFFDRPLKLAGRVVTEENGGLVARLYCSEEQFVIPSLAIHMNRDANKSFAPDMQTDMLPLYALGEANLSLNALTKDLYLVSAEKPFVCGAHGEFVCAPRIDNLTSVYACIQAITGETTGNCFAVCLDSEEIGNRTRQGAGSDFLKETLKRVARAEGMSEEDFSRTIASSVLISLDNAHSLHPNHAEKCDPTNRAVLGGGVVIKAHAGGAYTSDALTAGAMCKMMRDAGVRYQFFYNRSDMRSGGTLGDSSLTQIAIPSVDMGIAELAMHSAAETFAPADYFELERALKSYYNSTIKIGESSVSFS